ncbi:DUF3037 domain-containing protein [Paraconexibacter antarcticus]|uniref:DUF3037 domain-containing protein n=1 Tax=Paraconexibacter antarcticus TaxID=2949664 RepID=A0ABY5DUA6_9ACTN|nr:DUF3037 domain-containing protein [Paraconexibacter antarcticus]UTI64499.1 DUF3037 domain-containing protein [Paraconexibacter antarcticus]
MPAGSGEPFAYALLRVVPDVERGERLNVGVVLFCRRARFLEARTHVDPARLHALAPSVDAEAVAAHLRTLEHIAAGDPAGGPVAAQEPSERFHWLVAPASTIVQPSPVHTGLTEDAPATLARLMARLVE